MREPPAGGGLRGARLAELGLMTATLAHEMRQPIFAVKSLAQIAIAEHDRCAEELRALLRQVERLERVVEAIGVYSRDETGPEVPVDPAVPVRAAVELLSHRAGQGGVRVELALDPAVPAVRGEPTALMQAVTNLLHNAIDASPRGGRVRVETSLDDGAVVIEVADDGPGIPAELMDRVFDPFFTTKEAGRGTGLGLSLARRVVEGLGGRVVLAGGGGGLRAQVRLRPWRGPPGAG